MIRFSYRTETESESIYSSRYKEERTLAGHAFPLDRPVYQMNEAARLLGLPDKTLRRWIDGDRRFDRTIEPLIRLLPLATS